MSLLDFTTDGVLPPGDHELTLNQLRKSVLVTRPTATCPNWDVQWRAHLVDNLEILVNQLWQTGIEDVFIAGSFVEDVDHPNDIDGYFTCDWDYWITGRLQRELNLLDPHKIWTWDPDSRKPYPGYPEKLQLPMWHRYRVEFYPNVGQSTGIRDEHGSELMFPDAFRRSRSGSSRGIVKIVQSEK